MRQIIIGILVSLLGIVLQFPLTNVAQAQVVNSDPHFKAEGPKAYNCKTPKGRTVKCNKWSFSQGWKKVAIPVGKSPFSKLATVDARTVNIRRPDSGYVALYDYEWSDHRT
jgi:hypothetical protein